MPFPVKLTVGFNVPPDSPELTRPGEEESHGSSRPGFGIPGWTLLLGWLRFPDPTENTQPPTEREAVTAGRLR